MNLLQLTDYFSISQMKLMVSKQISEMVSKDNALEVIGVAERFNAFELEDYCVKFVCLNGV